MTDLWASSDISILFSEFEGMSISMLESMGQGCVPIVTDVSDLVGGISKERVPVFDESPEGVVTNSADVETNPRCQINRNLSLYLAPPHSLASDFAGTLCRVSFPPRAEGARQAIT